MTTPNTTYLRRWISGESAPSDAALFFAALLVASMPVSPFLLSISMWGLVFTAFWAVGSQRRREQQRIHWGAILVQSFRQLFRQPEYACFLLLLVLPALSGLWSADQGYWLERTRVRLPFLVLPWVFANLPRFSLRQYQLILYLLVWTMVVLCLGVGVNYALHRETILEALRQGRSIPVPRNHIRFSLLLATAVLAGGYLWRSRYYWRLPGERMALAAATLFLFVFLHFLSVRSGLVALYVGLFFILARFIWRTRRWQTGLVVVALLVSVPWVALNTLPSLKQKLAYTKYDWERYQDNEGGYYSDAERWISLKAGWLIWRENPWLGVGAGDLPAATARVVRERFPAYQAQPKLPHNQFLYILAGTGLLGLLGSLLAFSYPLFAGCCRTQYLFPAFQVMIFTSFLVEYTIETAMGVAWYLFYTLWFIQMACKQKNPTDNTF